jgi:hypothetical protein
MIPKRLLPRTLLASALLVSGLTVVPTAARAAPKPRAATKQGARMTLAAQRRMLNEQVAKLGYTPPVHAANDLGRMLSLLQYTLADGEKIRVGGGETAFSQTTYLTANEMLTTGTPNWMFPWLSVKEERVSSHDRGKYGAGIARATMERAGNPRTMEQALTILHKRLPARAYYSILETYP